MSTEPSNTPESLPHFTLDPYFDSPVMPSQWDLTSFPSTAKSTKESSPAVEFSGSLPADSPEQPANLEAASPAEAEPGCQPQLGSSLSTTPAKWDLSEILSPGSCR